MRSRPVIPEGTTVGVTQAVGVIEGKVDPVIGREVKVVEVTVGVIVGVTAAISVTVVDGPAVGGEVGVSVGILVVVGEVVVVVG